MTDLLVVAGEASGDLHGARLLSELLQRRPDVRAWGLGGDELRSAGLETVADAAEISVVGIVEVLKILRRAREIFDQLLDEVARRGTKTAVLIDFPDFNLRLAKALHARGVRVVYYVSPQVWAWRKGRVKQIARTVDRMLVLFPFEVDFYRRHGVDVDHVGHPLVEEVPTLDQAWQSVPAGELPSPVRIALLPGSRPSEVRVLLPRLLEAARQLAATRSVEVALIEAPSLPKSLVDELVAPSELPLVRLRTERHRAVADAHLALCASGTATLEVGLLGTPLVVVYRVSPWSYLLGRLLVDLPAISLVNLVLGTPAVPELLQGDAAPGHIAATAATLLDDREAIDRMRASLAGLRVRLGDTGASARAAALVAEALPAATDRPVRAADEVPA